MIFSPFEGYSQAIKNMEKLALKQEIRQILKEIAEEDAAKAAQPKEPEFKIDGPGFYETRDGRIAVITGIPHSDGKYHFEGYIQISDGGLDGLCGWLNSGHFLAGAKGNLDIVKKLTFKLVQES